MGHEVFERIKCYNPQAIPEIKLHQDIVLLKGPQIAGKRRRETFKGKVISVNTKHFTVENENGIKESFNYSEFVTGDLKIKVKQ